MRQLWISLLLIALSQAVLAQRTLNTVDLQQADAAQIIPALRPHLSPGSSISQFHNTLVINATREEWQTIRTLLKQLDQKARQLLITVRTHGHQTRSKQSLKIDGSLGNDNVRIGTSHSAIKTETRTQIIVRNNSTNTAMGDNQQVRATEGYPAYISTGQSVPVSSSNYYGQTTKLVDVSSGFYVTVFVTDNTVRLQVSQKNDQLKGNHIKTQQVQSSVSGLLGQWINLASLGNTQHRNDKKLLGYRKQAQQGQSHIALKVELVN